MSANRFKRIIIDLDEHGQVRAGHVEWYRSSWFTPDTCTGKSVDHSPGGPFDDIDDMLGWLLALPHPQGVLFE